MNPIQSIGYLDDGTVFLQIGLEINGQPMTGTLILVPDLARRVAQDLAGAADEADKRTRVLQ